MLKIKSSAVLSLKKNVRQYILFTQATSIELNPIKLFQSHISDWLSALYISHLLVGRRTRSCYRIQNIANQAISDLVLQK